LTTEATSAKTAKPAIARTSKPKVDHFAPPSGTTRLTEKNLKKMELEHAAAPTSKFSKDSRFKAREMND